MARFVHRTMVGETVEIGVRIEKFSQVVSRGSYRCVVLEEGGRVWTLEVSGRGQEEIDVYLWRDSTVGGDQFVELRLTVVDCLGLWGLSENRSLSFGGATHFSRAISLRQSPFNRWWFVPGDALTIRGRMTVYEERRRDFGSQREFRDAIGKSGIVRIAAWRIFWLFMFLAAVVAVGYAALAAVRYVVFSVVVPFLYYVVPPFLVFTLLIAWCVCELEKKARKVVAQRSRDNSRAPGNQMALVPAGGRGGYWPAGNRHGKIKRGSTVGIHDLTDNRYYEYEVPYRY